MKYIKYFESIDPKELLWQKDWDILSFRYKFSDDDYRLIDKKDPEFDDCLKDCIKSKWKEDIVEIHSVKRKSDNEVFTIGDRIYLEGYSSNQTKIHLQDIRPLNGTITKIWTSFDQIRADIGRLGTVLHEFVKVYKPKTKISDLTKNTNQKISFTQPITNYTINTNEAYSKNKIVHCRCGWEWNIEEGGEDPYTCHKCGHTQINEAYFNKSEILWEKIDRYQFSKFVDPDNSNKREFINQDDFQLLTKIFGVKLTPHEQGDGSDTKNNISYITNHVGRNVVYILKYADDWWLVLMTVGFDDDIYWECGEECGREQTALGYEGPISEIYPSCPSLAFLCDTIDGIAEMIVRVPEFKDFYY